MCLSVYKHVVPSGPSIDRTNCQIDFILRQSSILLGRSSERTPITGGTHYVTTTTSTTATITTTATTTMRDYSSAMLPARTY